MAKQSSNARKRARKKAIKEQGQSPTTKEVNGRGGREKPNHSDKKNKKRKRKNAPNIQENKEDEDDLLAFAQAWASNNSNTATTTKSKENNSSVKKMKRKVTSKKSIDRKPPPFPSGLPLPSSGFLRDEDPYRESFRAALDTSYEGLVWEGPNANLERELNQALEIMDEHRLFRTDVTQPAGLGAKLVPSYVTRCLLGDEGTTYKYLGLRMFSHPWNGRAVSGKKLQKALQSFESLNHRLEDRTKIHLQTLQQQRQSRQPQSSEEEEVIQGKSSFNVTLINRMTVHKRLREEPMFGSNKYSVGWHADSSLEHFSTIAVYHTLMTSKPKKKKSSGDDEWAVALRVTHDAEGPQAKRLGDIAVEAGAPPIAVALPSGCTYFLLDDYNHHHQHAVLAPHSNSSTIRYSSTHRLLRQGHKVQDMIAKCQKACGLLDHHGPKRWRSEQIVLNELENEWLRQFFIQGPEHKQLLWESYWKEPLKELFEYWEQLEARTLQVLTVLQKAAVQRCDDDNNNNSKGEALTTVMQVLGDRKKNALEAIYRPMATLLLQRAKSRELWAQRERDPVFQKLPENCRPIPFPVSYGKQDSHSGAIATSPLPEGSAAFLKELASNVVEWGKAFDTCNGENLSSIALA